MPGLSLGLGLGLTRQRPFSPLDLSPAGFWDICDTAMLFQDAAGTTPVTSAGDRVRLVLDKSGNGNDLTAPSDDARPIYGRHAKNLLKSSGDMLSWTAANCTKTDAGDGFTRLTTDGAGSYPRIEKLVEGAGDATFTLQVEARAGTSGGAILRAFGTGLGGGADTVIVYRFTFSTETFAKVAGANAATSPTFEEVETGIYRLTLTFTADTVDGVAFYPKWNDNTSGLTLDLRKPQLERNAAASSYVETDALGASGDPSQDFHFLDFDGVDDHMTGGPVHGANRTIGVAVMTPVGGAANGVVYGGRSSADLRPYISTSETGVTIRAGVGSDSVADSLTASLDAPHSAIMTHDGSDVTLCVDGGTVSTVSQAGLTTPGAEAYLGVLNNGGSAQAGTYFKGRVYAVVDVARVITAGERASLSTWMMMNAGAS